MNAIPRDDIQAKVV